ncbi:MAG: hypothetical protein AXW14_00330 [Alteromonas sp. Nap_26]|nr:MAG: hypothetical protein AXW14_00330 [Alteromonas sp. Nap_26]
MKTLVQRIIQIAGKAQFDNHALSYSILYLLMVAPPRALEIKHKEKKDDGELARVPTYLVVSLETTLRIASVLIIAACIELLMGNTLYELHRVDTFFVTLVVVGAVHSATYYLVFGLSLTSATMTQLVLLYRVVRNICYSLTVSFISVVPILIWNWDHGLSPFDDGLALSSYLITAVCFLFIGLIEALLMKRMPLGTT